MTPYIVFFLVAWIMWLLWEHVRDDLSCRYCGEYRGHKQDCPYDYDPGSSIGRTRGSDPRKLRFDSQSRSLELDQI